MADAVGELKCRAVTLAEFPLQFFWLAQQCGMQCFLQVTSFMIDGVIFVAAMLMPAQH